MKRAKVILGIMCSLAFLAPLQAFASGTLSGVGLLAGEAEEDGLDIYQVTLPTRNDFEIFLDPEGILSIYKTGEYDDSWAGKVHMADDECVLFVNQSSFPVRIDVGMSIEQDTKGAPSTIALLEDQSLVDDGVWPQMYLTIVPGHTKINDVSKFEPSDKKIPILSNGNEPMTAFSFLLNAADYVFDEETGAYRLAEGEDNYDSASFVLDGKVNKNADWSAYVGRDKEDLFIRTVFTIQKQDSYDEACLYKEQEGKKAPYALVKEGY